METNNISKNLSNTPTAQDIYIGQIQKLSILTREQEQECFAILSDSQTPPERARQARQTVINGMLRLVVYLAHRYKNRGIELEDLIQEGNIGVIHAITKFDITQGNRFATYASWWIRSYIVRTIQSKARMIKLPEHMELLLNKLNMARYQYLDKHDREPTEKELAQILEEPLNKIKNVLQLNFDHVSIEDMIVEPQLDANYDVGEEVLEITEQTLSLLSTLTPREELFIRSELNLSTWRCKPVVKEQLETQIIKKLRHPSRTSLIKDWLV